MLQYENTGGGMMKITPGMIVFCMWIALSTYAAFQVLKLLLSGDPI